MNEAAKQNSRTYEFIHLDRQFIEDETTAKALDLKNRNETNAMTMALLFAAMTSENIARIQIGLEFHPYQFDTSVICVQDQNGNNITPPGRVVHQPVATYCTQQISNSKNLRDNEKYYIVATGMRPVTITGLAADLGRNEIYEKLAHIENYNKTANAIYTVNATTKTTTIEIRSVTVDDKEIA